MLVFCTLLSCLPVHRGSMLPSAVTLSRLDNRHSVSFLLFEARKFVCKSFHTALHTRKFMLTRLQEDVKWFSSYYLEGFQLYQLDTRTILPLLQCIFVHFELNESWCTSFCMNTVKSSVSLIIMLGQSTQRNDLINRLSHNAQLGLVQTNIPSLILA